MDENEANVISLVERVNPSVVSIIITKDMPVIENYFENPFGEDVLPGFRIPSQRQRGTREEEIGGGSGFIVSKDGYIITNRHVVNDTEAEYTVLTNDERKYQAEVLGRDSINDIAVLKIDPKNPIEGEGVEELPLIELGNSGDLKTGQTVIAIGNALGEYRNTVSKGIVSGLKRNIIAGDSLGNTQALSELIQTDAALNRGNSGGPLINLAGEVIGINVASSQMADNISFAIPINDAKQVIESIRTEGRIVRPYLGIRYILNNEEFAKSNNLDYDYGALVVRGETRGELAVLPSSPADKADILENDLILEIDGEKITESYTPANAISDKKPGDTVNLKILRDGEIIEKEVELEERKNLQSD
ncbi:MAG: trypsin-like serine protease [Candidatus Moranbacteria bacterium]|nr:trypsin-like serine protease [Candidatus Moranbacteria bacterium]